MLETRLTASDLSPFSFGASAGPSACVVLVVSRAISDRALVEHGVGHLHETGDVGPRHVVTWPIVLLGRLADRVVDPPHDRLQTSVDLLFGPLDELHALSHLQPGHRHPAGVLYAPSKAAHAGGVAVSGREMAQGMQLVQWSKEEVDGRLQAIMRRIHDTVRQTAEEYDRPGDYMAGANIAGFVKVADAMLDESPI